MLQVEGHGDFKAISDQRSAQTADIFCKRFSGLDTRS
jgi:hypothetical protein